jgi:hypothetical protein
MENESREQFGMPNLSLLLGHNSALGYASLLYRAVETRRGIDSMPILTLLGLWVFFKGL